VWTVGVTGLILAAVILWNYVSVLERVEAEAAARASYLAEGSADKISAELALLEGLVRGMALVLETQDLAVPVSQIRALQDAALRTYPQIGGTAIALLPDVKPADWPDAVLYAVRGFKGTEHLELARSDLAYLTEDWFHLPRLLAADTWTEPYRGANGLLMVTYSAPIHVASAEGQRFAGVIKADVELDWLDQVIADLPVGQRGYGSLITRNGTYISHPLREIVESETVFSIAEGRQDKALREIGQRMTSGDSGLVPWVSWAHGDPSWLAWAPVDNAYWTMVTVVSKAELRAILHRLTQQSALVGLAGLSLLVLAVWLLARSITRPVRALGDAACALSAGRLDATLPDPRGQDEVAQVTRAFATMRDNLKRYIADLAETTAARERMNGELRIAHDIQMDLVPKTFPAFPNRDDIDLYAVMEPAREVGGDFYDFFMLDADRLVVAIGDVSGKGVPAALFMAVTRSFLRAAFRADDDPAAALVRVNDDLAERNESCMFVTLFCAVIRLGDGQVEYANAGHNPPLVVDSTGVLRWIDSPFGTAAGAMPGSPYATGRFQLEPDALLLLYTDGVTEAMDRENRLYGNARLAEQLEASRALACRETLAYLLGDIRVFADGAEQSDDITMLLVQRIGVRTDGSPFAADVGPAAMALGGSVETAGDGADEGRADAETSDVDAQVLEVVVENRAEALAVVLDDVEAFMDAAGAISRLKYAVMLAIEELVTNTIKYGYDDADAHQIRLRLDLRSPVTLRIEDDGHPFDPNTQAPEVSSDAALEDRPIGGLGLHMVRAQTTSFEYRRIGEINRVDLQFPDGP
jgi:sigma-B regulation protein RsbU (phosphoserine phosphatase)